MARRKPAVDRDTLWKDIVTVVESNDGFMDEEAEERLDNFLDYVCNRPEDYAPTNYFGADGSVRERL